LDEGKRLMEFYATLDADSLSDSLHRFIPNVPVLLPASSWARYGLKTPNLPSHVEIRAADCGGFVATKIWGDYRYTLDQYVEWLRSFAPVWAATMDYCCEDEITSGNQGVVRERQEKTTANAWSAFNAYRSEAWAWVVTIQGWNPEDYISHIQSLRPLLQEMQAYYKDNPWWRVGIGTLCARKDTGRVLEIVYAVAGELPGVPLHLWGVKLDVLKGRRSLPEQVISVDSAAWNNLFFNKAYRDLGMRQREYTYTISLPAYLRKFEAALRTRKQRMLF
jgi:hypothetical protein